MSPLEKVRLTKALIIDEQTKELDQSKPQWVTWPYNRNVTPEEMREAKAIKRAFAEKCLGVKTTTV